MGRVCVLSLVLISISIGPVYAGDGATDPAEQVLRLGADPVDVRWLAKRTLRRAGLSAVPALISGLKSEERFVRAACARILGTVTVGSDVAVEALIEACSDEEPWAREAAVKALGWIGPAAADAIPTLEGAVRDSEHGVRRAGIEALGELGAAGAPALIKVLQERAFSYLHDPSDAIRNIGGPAVPALTETLRTAVQDPWLRHSAALLLGKIGRAAKEAAPVLLAAMKDDDPRVALAAAFGYGVVTGDDKPARPLLARGLRHGTPSVHELSMWVVSELHCSDPDVLDALIERLDDPGPPETPSAVGPVREIGRPALEKLLEAMGKRTSDKRKAHAEALVEIRPLVPEAVPYLIDALGYDRFDGDAGLALMDIGAASVAPLAAALGRKEQAVREAAARTLGRMGGNASEASPVLVAALSDATIRLDAAVALSLIAPETPALLPVLVEYSHTGKPGKRQWAIEALGRALPIETSRAELDRLLTDEKNWARKAAALAIWKQSEDATAFLPFLLNDLRAGKALVEWDFREIGRPAVGPLLDVLEDEDFGEQFRAYKSLELIGPDAVEAVPYLTTRLTDNGSSVRCWAAGALHGIGPAAKAAAPPLVKLLLEDESIYVRQAAAEALGIVAPGDNAAEAALRKSINSGTADIRRKAALALWQSTGDAEQAVAVILDIVLDREEIYDDRREAVGALGEIGPAAAESLPTLLRLLRSREQFMGEYAAYAVALVGGPRSEVIDALVRTLGHREWIIRKAAVQALGRLGPTARPALPAVEARTCDRNQYVRESARDALAAIRGR